MSNSRVVVIGGGAAGFFGAITAAECGALDVLILEKGPEVLTKVRISGGGRCNVTHACFEPKELLHSYPRGSKSLMGPFHRWQVGDTVEWFAKNGVELKTEDDGRMFPVTDDSRTVIDCLTRVARNLGVKWRTHCGVANVEILPDSGFLIETEAGEKIEARSILIATGGIRSGNARKPVECVRHAMAPPVPSLFTFKIDDPRLADLQGVSVPNATVRAGSWQASGPLLVTHWGLSGPAALKVSAWGARDLADCGYDFELRVSWAGNFSAETISGMLAAERQEHGARKVMRHSIVEGVTKRLWQKLCTASGIEDERTWSTLTKDETRRLIGELTDGRYAVRGKSLNKDEFVTCGGVHLKDVNLKTMESKLTPGVFFAGEVLDIDGVTGGFNFQAAWTTGRIAGETIAERK
ncbi:MAG: NAD(P)/FAD-dependent oxidoreductase [Luteolibacter sp.]